MQHTIFGQNLVVYNFFPDGSDLELTLTPESGSIISRFKIDTVFKIEHKGFLLGYDQYHRWWTVHHHYLNKYPTLDLFDDFSQGMPVSYDDRKSIYSQQITVERALSYVESAGSFSALSQNCQQFVNAVAFNQKFSEGVESISDKATFAGFACTLFGIATKNKTATGLGLGMIAVSEIARSSSRS